MTFVLKKLYRVAHARTMRIYVFYYVIIFFFYYYRPTLTRTAATCGTRWIRPIRLTKPTGWISTCTEPNPVPVFMVRMRSNDNMFCKDTGSCVWHGIDLALLTSFRPMGKDTQWGETGEDDHAREPLECERRGAEETQNEQVVDRRSRKKGSHGRSSRKG